ncbi:MAG: hypothetical protein QNJ33_06360 [Crocosphaera sp.]|nr:hypothetical protein [Crocosphaera sp.]
MKKLITSFISIGIILLIHPLRTYGSTTVDYSSFCHYIDSKGQLSTSTTCQVNFGIVGVDRGLRFILTFPNGAEVWIYDLKGKCTANNIPCKLMISGNNVAVITEEGEVFVFREYR